MIVHSLSKTDSNWRIEAESRTIPRCPLCGTCSERRHAWYYRTLRDLPVQGVPLIIRLKTRKWRCRVPNCDRSVFTERLPSLAAPRARQTDAIADILAAMGHGAGGEVSRKLLARLGIVASGLGRPIASSRDLQLMAPLFARLPPLGEKKKIPETGDGTKGYSHSKRSRCCAITHGCAKTCESQPNKKHGRWCRRAGCVDARVTRACSVAPSHRLLSLPQAARFLNHGQPHGAPCPRGRPASAAWRHASAAADRSDRPRAGNDQQSSKF